MNELSTVLLTIISTVAPLIGGGSWFFHRQNKRLKEAEARLAEVNVDKAKVETRAEDWHIWKEQCEALTEQNKSLIERNTQFVKINAEKEDRHQQDIKDWEERFTKQTEYLRGVQRELTSAIEDKVTLTKENGELKVKLEKFRCDDLDCPFRLPPNAHTPVAKGVSKEQYVKTRKIK